MSDNERLMEALRRAAEGCANPEALTEAVRQLGDALRGEAAARRCAETALRESQRLYRRLRESMMDAFVAVDMEGRLTDFNAAFVALAGRPEAELRRLTYRDLMPARWHDLEAGIVAEQILPRGYSDVYEMEYIRGDGTCLPVEMRTFLLRDAAGRPDGMWAIVRDISGRKRTEAALRLTQLCIDQAAIGVFRVAQDGRILEVNQQACRSLGYTREELLALTIPEIDPNFPPPRWQEHREDLRQRGFKRFETVHRRKDGSTFPVEVSVNYHEFAGERFSFSFAVDISERKQAEEERARLETELFQAQKMESVGRLAGGVAHDFNNMLSVILGYTELIRTGLAQEDPLRQDILEIERAAGHSRDITRQLLAFSRRQIIAPRPTDLNALIARTRKTLARLIGEDIDLVFRPAGELWQVRVDHSQIDQILINLAVNARDAMPEGGRLTIATANVVLGEDDCRDQVDLAPGDYVRLRVGDDGVGMERAVLRRAFEPFFTTKEHGKGTGLGLATVYGIIKQLGGHIHVDSEPGRGTAFAIHFPRIVAAGETAAAGAEAAPAAGTGRILLVEDDDLVRKMTHAMLEALGYSVLVADGPDQALALCADETVDIDLLLTDVVMPGMNGPELRDRIRRIRPGIAVLFMSGYTSDVTSQQGILQDGVHFLQKPFTKADLAREVQAALAGA